MVKSELDLQRSQDRTVDLQEQLNLAKKELIDLQIAKVQCVNEYETKLNEASNNYK